MMQFSVGPWLKLLKLNRLGIISYHNHHDLLMSISLNSDFMNHQSLQLSQYINVITTRPSYFFSDLI
jgi:hypothetical protein